MHWSRHFLIWRRYSSRKVLRISSLWYLLTSHLQSSSTIADRSVTKPPGLLVPAMNFPACCSSKHMDSFTVQKCILYFIEHRVQNWKFFFFQKHDGLFLFWHLIMVWILLGGSVPVLVCDIHVRCVMCDIVCYIAIFWWLSHKNGPLSKKICDSFNVEFFSNFQSFDCMVDSNYNLWGLKLLRFLGQDYNSQTFVENRQPAEYPFNCSLKPKSARKKAWNSRKFCVFLCYFWQF